MEKRNLQLASRKENTREIKYIPVVPYELSEIKKHFDESVKMIEDQFSIGDELLLEKKITQAEFLWRSQIVLLESAFDFFMHEITKYGLCRIYDGHWPETKKYQNIQIDMAAVSAALKNRDSGWFLNYINSYYAGKTLVSFEAVKDQINLLGLDLQEIADNAFYEKDSIEKTKDKIKRRLNQLYARRNLIAHQCDRRHEDAQINEISREIIQEFLKDIELIVNAICKEVSSITG